MLKIGEDIMEADLKEIQFIILSTKKVKAL
jgi:hypothetical protein